MHVESNECLALDIASPVQRHKNVYTGSLVHTAWPYPSVGLHNMRETYDV